MKLIWLLSFIFFIWKICDLKIKFDMKMLIFNSFLLLLRWLKEGKTKAKNGLTSLSYLFTL